jgi:hypothetical protein
LAWCCIQKKRISGMVLTWCCIQENAHFVGGAGLVVLHTRRTCTADNTHALLNVYFLTWCRIRDPGMADNAIVCGQGGWKEVDLGAGRKAWQWEKAYEPMPVDRDLAVEVRRSRTTSEEWLGWVIMDSISVLNWDVSRSDQSSLLPVPQLDQHPAAAALHPGGPCRGRAGHVGATQGVRGPCHPRRAAGQGQAQVRRRRSGRSRGGPPREELLPPDVREEG